MFPCISVLALPVLACNTAYQSKYPANIFVHMQSNNIQTSSELGL